ncbi:MAG: CDP-glycerol glycerophosphotransferase family protein [Ilumatobacter sp.]
MGLRSRAEQRFGKYRVFVLIRAVQWPVNAALRAVVSRVPRDRNLVAFGVPLGRFADNPAHLFAHMSEHSDLRCVWVSGSAPTVDLLRSMGFDAVRRWSPEGVRVALRASWYVFSHSRSDINSLLGHGATAFNLWHGVGIKRIRMSMNQGWKTPVFAAREGSLRARLFAPDREVPDWFLSTSPLLSEKFTEAYALHDGACVELGYPRNDVLFGTAAESSVADPVLRERIDRRHPVVGYFPTFRDVSATIPGGSPMISDIVAIVERQGGSLVFKEHDRTSVENLDESGAIVLPKEADLNSYLDLCDVLVTDYSSVANDFLLLRRPIVHFCPDLDVFLEGRGFYFDPLTHMPGVMTRTRVELYDILGALDVIPGPTNVDQLVEHFWGSTATAGASRRVARFIERGGPAG